MSVWLSFMSEHRSRNHALISYLTKTQIESVLQKHIQDIKDFAFICHDRDIKDDGTPKEIHFHIVIHLYNPKSYDVVRKWFYDSDISPDKQNTLIKPVIDLKAALDYLTHKNDPDKAQYDSSEIITNNTEWVNQPDDDSKDSKSINILNDLLDGCSFSTLLVDTGESSL